MFVSELDTQEDNSKKVLHLKLNSIQRRVILRLPSTSIDNFCSSQ